MRLVIVEGHDGAGKSTFVEALKLNYTKRGFSVGTLRFPESIPPAQVDGDPLAAPLYYLSDFQRQLTAYKEEPDIFIADRSFITTMVYQGFQGNHVCDWELCQAIATLGSRAFLRLPATDVEVVLLHCSLTEAVRRTSVRVHDRVDTFERRSVKDRIQTLQRLIERYHLIVGAFQLGSMFPSGRNTLWEEANIIKVDTTTLTPDEVLQKYLVRSFEPEYFSTEEGPE